MLLLSLVYSSEQSHGVMLISQLSSGICWQAPCFLLVLHWLHLPLQTEESSLAAFTFSRAPHSLWSTVGLVCGSILDREEAMVVYRLQTMAWMFLDVSSAMTDQGSKGWHAMPPPPLIFLLLLRDTMTKQSYRRAYCLQFRGWVHDLTRVGSISRQQAWLCSSSWEFVLNQQVQGKRGRERETD